MSAWLVAPGVQVAAAFHHDPEAACQGHFCQCRRHCPPARPNARDCHEAAKGAPSCEMNSRCSHDGPSAPSASRPEWLPSTAQGLHLLVASSPAPGNAAGEPAAGHWRIEPRPPRTASQLASDH